MHLTLFCKFMDKNLDCSLKNAFQCAKYQDDCYYITLDDKISINDILEFAFFESLIPVEKDSNLKLVTVEKNRFINEEICYLCGNVGHVMRECKVNSIRRCQWCDMEHTTDNCQFKYCSNCRNIGHFEKYCPTKKQKIIPCKICLQKSNGKILHDIDDCPKIWKRYKLLGDVKIKKNFSCPRCLSHNHYLGDCKLVNQNISIFSKNWSLLCNIDLPNKNIKNNKSKKNSD